MVELLLLTLAEEALSDVRDRLSETEIKSHIESVLIDDSVVVAVHDDTSDSELIR